MTFASDLSPVRVLVITPLEVSRDQFNTPSPFFGNCTRHVYTTFPVPVWDVPQVLLSCQNHFRFVQVFGEDEVSDDWKQLVVGTHQAGMDFIDSTVKSSKAFFFLRWEARVNIVERI